MSDLLGLKPNQFRQLLADLAENQVLIREGRDKTLRIGLGESRRVAVYPSAPYVGGVAGNLDDPDSWSGLDELSGYREQLAAVFNEKSESQTRLLRTRIEELDFTIRTYNCLKKDSIQTVGDLMGCCTHHLMQLRNFGRKSLVEVQEQLSRYDLTLPEYLPLTASRETVLSATLEEIRCPRALITLLGHGGLRTGRYIDTVSDLLGWAEYDLSRFCDLSQSQLIQLKEVLEHYGLSLPSSAYGSQPVDLPLPDLTVSAEDFNRAVSRLQSQLAEYRSALAEAEELDTRAQALWRRLTKESMPTEAMASSLVTDCRSTIQQLSIDLAALQHAASLVAKYLND